MKTLILILFLVLLPITCWAGPFLTCDPYSPDDGITHFQVIFEGSNMVESPAINNTLRFDLATLAPGTHTVRVRACNIWGCSADSAPFTFAKRLPVAPKQIIIAK